MSSDWVYMVPLKVFSEIKENFSNTIKDKYQITDKNFSTVGSSDAPAVFPFIYLKTLPATEIGATFDNGINAATFGFQVDVTDNKTQSNARQIMVEITKIMNQMGFRTSSFGNFEDTRDTHRIVARFERVIGANDNFFSF